MSSAPHEDDGMIPVDTLAARLVLVRRQLGLTQREAAERCGLTFGEWQSMEDGRQARGLNSKIQRIALGLRVNRNWLMWGGPLTPPEDINIRSSSHDHADSDEPDTFREFGVSWSLAHTA